MARPIRLFAFAALLLAEGTVTSQPPEKTAAAASAAAVAWQPWSSEAFARAKREQRLVLVDVGIEGCTACRWMHQETYRDPDVARRIRERFVPVSVDADTQPDLGERFEEWGWPATIVLTPTAPSVGSTETVL